MDGFSHSEATKEVEGSLGFRMDVFEGFDDMWSSFERFQVLCGQSGSFSYCTTGSPPCIDEAGGDHSKRASELPSERCP